MEDIEVELAPLRASVKEQGDLVRKLKLDGVAEIDIKKEVQILKQRKKILEDTVLKLTSETDSFDRTKMMDLIKRRFFFDISFAIYGGISGQYDYGPMGCKIVKNMLTEWSSHFENRENMMSVECSILTPETVLKASGHMDKFADYMVKDIKTGECFRLDHLIKQCFEKILSDKKTTSEQKDTILRKLALLEGMSMIEMDGIVKQYDFKSPVTGNDLSDAVEFNLMFPISIGPSGNVKGFLRPETAQGIFVNFKRLLESNQGKIPFACAQIGKAYRNEISPRSGLLRVREFTMAEIEHFCYPDDKSCQKFNQVADTILCLYSASDQMDGKSPSNITIKEAVDKGLVANETLGYYMARIQQFLINIGINAKKLRFRQHLSNEMAHYACDCWDGECLTSYGWIECVGCADRSAFDLGQHAKATGVKLTVERLLPEPRTVTTVTPVVDKSALGKQFKKNAGIVSEALFSLSSEQLKQLDETIESTGSYLLNGFEITRSIVKEIKHGQNVVHVEEIVPSVIEPSFGIGRIFYSLLEHTFRVREEDNKRTYFALPPLIAPVKVSILPLSSKPEFEPFTQQLVNRMTELRVSYRVDDSTGSIGRRYARTDEIAIPFGVTVDFDTVNNEPRTVTLRERDSTIQIRIPIDEVAAIVRSLVEGDTEWEKVANSWPKFVSQETSK